MSTKGLEEGFFSNFSRGYRGWALAQCVSQLNVTGSFRTHQQNHQILDTFHPHNMADYFEVEARIQETLLFHTELSEVSLRALARLGWPWAG